MRLRREGYLTGRLATRVNFVEQCFERNLDFAPLGAGETFDPI